MPPPKNSRKGVKGKASPAASRSPTPQGRSSPQDELVPDSPPETPLGLSSTMPMTLSKSPPDSKNYPSKTSTVDPQRSKQVGDDDWAGESFDGHIIPGVP